MKTTLALFVLLLTATPAFATDYLGAFNKLYDDLTYDTGSVAPNWKTDFSAGAYSHCAETAWSTSAQYSSVVLGVCSYTSPAAGPEVPAQSFEAPCDAPDGGSIAYGFQDKNAPRIDRWQLNDDTTAAGSLYVSEIVNGVQRIVHFRKNSRLKYMAFQSEDKSYAGYCW